MSLQFHFVKKLDRIIILLVMFFNYCAMGFRVIRLVTATGKLAESSGHGVHIINMIFKTDY